MRIFISSTFKDLRPEREKSKQALERMDILGRRMEVFVSEPIRPIEVALRELQHSDAVVLIIGFRAGSLLDESSDLTYTRAEFDRARELKRPIFLFVKTQNGRWRNEEDDPRLRHALDALKEAAQAEQTPSYFENEDQLMAEVVVAIARWKEMGRPGARSTFASWDEHFPPRVGLFDYDQTLRGRAKEIAQLEDFLADDKGAVGVLLGRGGVGKSKLLRDWSRGATGWQPVFLRENAIWHSEAPKEVPAGKVLLIADDAHRFAELPQLLSLARELFEAGRCKLLVCGRPSGQGDIDDALARTFDAPSVSRFPALDGLEFKDSEKLAEEVLGDEFGPLARQLAAISKDAPLVTVIGGRLIASRRVSPLLLVNDDEFRRAIFDKYLAEYERLLPSGPVVWRDLLALIAALSPLFIGDSHFLGLAADLLRLRRDEILQASETLEKHGLLIRSGGLVRIVPDVLSDYLLEQACVRSDGEPTLFADEIFTRFQATHLASALRNLAELDWRIAHKRASSGLLDRVWMGFFEDYKRADAARRCTMLDSFKDAAFFQPSRAIELVRYSIANPVPPTGEVGWFQSGQIDILHKLPAVLQNVAHHGAHVDGAIKLLWNLAKEDTRDTNSHPGHALRVLQDLASYGRYKGVDFYLRIAGSLLDILADPSAFESRYTPLDVVDEFLKKEGEHRESEGWTIQLSAFALAHDRVREIRRRALKMVEACLAMENPRPASRAVKSLSKVLSGFVAKFGRHFTDAELVWQDAERLEAVAMIRRRIEHKPLPVPLAREVRQMLKHFGRGNRPDEVRASVERLLSDIGYSDELFVYDTFCTSTWDYDVIVGDREDRERRFSDRVQRAKKLFREKYPNPVDQIAALEEMLSQAARYGVDALGPSFSLIQSLCYELDFRLEFSTYVFAGASLGMASQIQALLPILRQTSPEEYERLGSAAARGSRSLALGAANATCYGGTLQSPMAPDLQILALLSQHGDRDIRSCALTGIGRLGKSGAYRDAAIALALDTDIANDCALGNDLANVFHPSNIDPNLLAPTQVRAIFDRLAPLSDLDGNGQSYYLSEFLDWACINQTDLTFEFIIARLDYAAALRSKSGEWQSYDAVPHPEIHARFRGFARTAQYSALLARVRDRLVMKDHSAHDLTQLFWSMGALDAKTLAVMDAWLHSGDEAKVTAILHLVRAAPHDLPFSFPYFALHLLHCASEFGDEAVQEAIDDLVLRTRSRSWLGAPSEPPPDMLQLRDMANQLAQRASGIPEGLSLFSVIAEAFNRDINSWRQSGEER
jgi:Domain of unknown function (DUF4062)